MHGDDNQLAATFDTVAETYARARPGYPAQLFDDLAESTGLGSTPPARVLEIGPGTGQATRGLLARGWQVVALEPGPNLAAVARRELHGLGDVDVHVSTFESWTGDDESFDLVFAATSFHWLEPTVAFAQAARLLRPAGSLAVVSTEHVLPADGDLFFREVEDAYAAVGMSDGLGGPSPPERVPAPHSAAILASGLFEAPVQRRYVWAQAYSAEEYLRLLSTYSGHIAASPQQREALFGDIRARIDARPGRAVRKHYLTVLETARRRGRAGSA